MRRKKRVPGYIRIGLLCFVLMALRISACQNPFTTREPEPPADTRSTWYQPVSPELIIDNFIAAVQEKSVENYIRCFGAEQDVRSGFRFVPEQSVANNYQGVFAAWTIIEERNYINNLFGQIPPDSISSLILTDVTETLFSDSVRTTKDYNLTVHHTDPTVARYVAGRMELTLRKGADAFWYIASWADFKMGDDPVWSILKAKF